MRVETETHCLELRVRGKGLSRKESIRGGAAGEKEGWERKDGRRGGRGGGGGGVREKWVGGRWEGGGGK